MRPVHTSLTCAGLLALAVTAAGADDKKRPPDPAPPQTQPSPPQTQPSPPQTQPTPPAAPAPSGAIADHAKSMKATRKCSGTRFAPDGTSTAIAGTLKTKLEVDGFWEHVTFTGTGKGAYKFEAYRGFDVKSGGWQEVLVDNLGSHHSATSAGPQNYKITWLGEVHTATGNRKIRNTEELLMGGKQLTLTGDTSPDGKTWIKSYEMVCKP